MKRSKNIRLFLIGGLSTAALTGCDQKPAVSAQNFYTNNFYLPGAGYYHAPFRNWYWEPYNYYDASKQLYFYGGQWGVQPCSSVTNISSPLPEAVNLAENYRTDVTRGGFGGCSSGHYYGGSGWGGGGWGGGGGGWGGSHFGGS